MSSASAMDHRPAAADLAEKVILKNEYIHHVMDVYQI
jgi:hypothetical protein